MLPALLRHKLSRRVIVAGIVVLMALTAGVSWSLFHGTNIDLDINTGTARRPLVVQNGKVTQMPAGDYLAANTLVDTTACSDTNVIKWDGSQFACGAGGGGSGGGITNSAGANVVMLSDGTNAVASNMSQSGDNTAVGSNNPLFLVMQGSTEIPPIGNPVVALGGTVPGSSQNPANGNYGTFEGIGETVFKYPVGFNGQSAPLYTIDILSDEHNMTAEDIKIRIGWSGGYDTTAGAITSRNIVSEANGQRNAGSNPLNNVAGYFDARNGQTNVAIHTDLGDDLFDGAVTIGTVGTPKSCTIYGPTAVNGAETITASTTTAGASLSGTGLEIATGGAHNYLTFRNPDATDAAILFNNVTGQADGYFSYKHSTGVQIGSQNAVAATLTASTATFAGAVQVGGGAKWTSAAGAPSGACNIGDLYSNTTGSTSTTLYVCTSSAVWTAK